MKNNVREQTSFFDRYLPVEIMDICLIYWIIGIYRQF